MATAAKEIQISEPHPVHSGYWQRWVGKSMVFQTKSKTIIAGTLKEFRNCFLAIENAKVIGVNKVAHAPLVMLDRNFISHFHEECPVEDVQDGSKLVNGKLVE